jgi:short-chain Z-isoprenyl diphosphate synthase
MKWSGPLYRLYERRLVANFPPARLPQHIGVILDGHRRFAHQEGLRDYLESYRYGVAKLEEFLGWCTQLHIPAVTAWVLSTDNLGRSPDDLEPLFAVLGELLAGMPALASRLGFSLQVIGSIDLLPTSLILAVKEAEQDSQFGAWQLNLAVGYGGRQEIVDACRSLITELQVAEVPEQELAERINAAGLSQHLYASNLPDPDLVIRTSGETRLSGFLLWQAAYSEFVFVDPNWPAFRRVDFLRVLRDYVHRDRRYGR